jgi:hypothetical protein
MAVFVVSRQVPQSASRVTMRDVLKRTHRLSSSTFQFHFTVQTNNCNTSGPKRQKRHALCEVTANNRHILRSG